MGDKRQAAYGGHPALNDDLFHSIEADAQGNRGLGVFVMDQTTPTVDRYLTQLLNIVTLAAPTVVDTFTISLVAGHNVVAGDMINIQEGSSFSQFEALSEAADVVTLDAQMDKVYTTDATVERGNRSMLVNGSVTPVVFGLRPISTLVWDITRAIAVIESTTAQDFSTFGNQSALTRGCLFRCHNGQDVNLFNYKTNGDIINRSFDHDFQTKSGGGLFGFTVRSTWSGNDKRGVALRLVGADDDEFQHIIQDNLSSGTAKFNVIAQGHVAEEPFNV